MMLKGLGVSAGFVTGKAFVIESAEEKSYSPFAADPEREVARLKAAIEKSREQIAALALDVSSRLSSKDAEIIANLENYLADPLFNQNAEAQLRGTRASAEKVIDEITAQACAELAFLEDQYFSERAADVRDVGERILRNLMDKPEAAMALEASSILIAKDLSPSQTARLDASRILGFAIEAGSYTSHTAILARSLGVAAVTGCKGLTDAVRQGDILAMDGAAGTIRVNPPEEILREYAEKKTEFEKTHRLYKTAKDKKLRKNGRQIWVAANIGTPAEALVARENGADGIGLFRTEFLFMQKSAMPGEEEQYEAYRQVAEIFRDAPVIIRTLDVGGDKPLPYIPMPWEENPFLGVRALRLCLRNPELFKIQLRAILRANVFGNLWVMFPMVGSVSELRKAKVLLEEAKGELAGRGIAFNPDIRTGIMVEIPSAAILADTLAAEVDFFSIGTNDLTQYTLAVDRSNGEVAELYDSMNPAVLALIQNTLEAAHRHQIFCGMCGELAGEARATALLNELGLDEFSVDAASVARVKYDLLRTGGGIEAE